MEAWSLLPDELQFPGRAASCDCGFEMKIVGGSHIRQGNCNA